jgi:hypothetical protein
MKIFTARAGALGLAVWALVGLAGCEQDEVMWETTSGAVGAQTGDREALDEEWRDYRVASVAALDEMSRKLDATRRKGSVADRAVIDGLASRIDELRAAMIAEMDDPDPSTSERALLRDDFDGLQREIAELIERIDPASS